MKKILILFFAILALVSCANKSRTLDKEVNAPIPWSYVTEYTYKGHDYIKFSSRNQAGVIHNPDCRKCSKL